MIKTYSKKEGEIQVSEWSILLLLAATVIFYQFGWLINSLCHGIFTILFEGKIRDPIFAKKNLEYEMVRATVYQKASSDLREDLGVDRSVIRLARAGVLNFGLIALAMFSFVGTIAQIAGMLALLCSIGCLWQWCYRYRRYYRRMLSAYHVITRLEATPEVTNVAAAPHNTVLPTSDRSLLYKSRASCDFGSTQTSYNKAQEVEKMEPKFRPIPITILDFMAIFLPGLVWLVLIVTTFQIRLGLSHNIVASPLTAWMDIASFMKELGSSWLAALSLIVASLLIGYIS